MCLHMMVCSAGWWAELTERGHRTAHMVPCSHMHMGRKCVACCLCWDAMLSCNKCHGGGLMTSLAYRLQWAPKATMAPPHRGDLPTCRAPGRYAWCVRQRCSPSVFVFGVLLHRS